MPWAKVRFDPGGERGVGDAFVQLEEVGMSATDAEPEDLGMAFCREGADAIEREEKARELDRGQLSAELLFCFRADISEKRQGEMNLLRGVPAHAGQMRIQPNE